MVTQINFAIKSELFIFIPYLNKCYFKTKLTLFTNPLEDNFCGSDINPQSLSPFCCIVVNNGTLLSQPNCPPASSNRTVALLCFAIRDDTTHPAVPAPTVYMYSNNNIGNLLN